MWALREAGRDQTRGTLGTPVKSLTVQQGDSCREKRPQAVTAQRRPVGRLPGGSGC